LPTDFCWYEPGHIRGWPNEYVRSEVGQFVSKVRMQVRGGGGSVRFRAKTFSGPTSEHSLSQLGPKRRGENLVRLRAKLFSKYVTSKRRGPVSYVCADLQRVPPLFTYFSGTHPARFSYYPWRQTHPTEDACICTGESLIHETWVVSDVLNRESATTRGWKTAYLKNRVFIKFPREQPFLGVKSRSLDAIPSEWDSVSASGTNLTIQHLTHALF